MVWLITILVLFFLIPFICGLFGIPIFKTQEQDETSEQDELNEITKQERIDLLDNTIIKYNNLLDNLAAQYKDEINEKKKAAILKQQIIAMEKLNKALEKREKLE